jgi:uncharacterized membrane protein
VHLDLLTLPIGLGALVAGFLGSLTGLVTLIARVLLSLVAFALQRDRTTLIVLVVLLSGLFGVGP